MGWEWCGNRGKLREEIVASPLSHSPFEGKKKKTCNNFNCSIKLNPNFGWGHALFVYNFLDYLSWINLVKLICWSISVTLKPFETLDFTSPRAPTWTLWGPVTESWPLIFSWKLFHRSLVGGPKKHPSSFSIRLFFFFLWNLVADKKWVKNLRLYAWSAKYLDVTRSIIE